MRRIAVILGIGTALVGAAGAFAAGASAAGRDSIRIAGSGPVVRGSVYDVTISGFAAQRATAWLFVDYAGCARTLAGELRRAPSSAQHFAVQGPFAEVTGWKSSAAGTDHACAYLAPRGRTLVLSRARLAFPVR
ncbi:MAG TPA: hypothetical protein VFN55_08440 [Solirubrobacteraceae bacterium]|nr:hypothetical protein [Solirubrobacteraceae bacterium]